MICIWIIGRAPYIVSPYAAYKIYIFILPRRSYYSYTWYKSHQLRVITIQPRGGRQWGAASPGAPSAPCTSSSISILDQVAVKPTLNPEKTSGAEARRVLYYFTRKVPVTPKRGSLEKKEFSAVESVHHKNKGGKWLWYALFMAPFVDTWLILVSYPRIFWHTYILVYRLVPRSTEYSVVIRYAPQVPVVTFGTYIMWKFVWGLCMDASAMHGWMFDMIVIRRKDYDNHHQAYVNVILFVAWVVRLCMILHILHTTMHDMYDTLYRWVSEPHRAAHLLLISLLLPVKFQ